MCVECITPCLPACLTLPSFLPLFFLLLTSTPLTRSHLQPCPHLPFPHTPQQLLPPPPPPPSPTFLSSSSRPGGLTGDTKFVGGWEQLPQRATLPMKGPVAAARYKQAGRLASATSHQPRHTPSCRRDYRPLRWLNSTLYIKNTEKVILATRVLITKARLWKTDLVARQPRGEIRPEGPREKTGVCVGKVRVEN